MNTKDKEITSITDDWIMDTTVITYSDGTYEERYSNGRVEKGIRHDKCLDHDEPILDL